MYGFVGVFQSLNDLAAMALCRPLHMAGVSLPHSEDEVSPRVATSPPDGLAVTSGPWACGLLVQLQLGRFGLDQCFHSSDIQPDDKCFHVGKEVPPCGTWGRFREWRGGVVPAEDSLGINGADRVLEMHETRPGFSHGAHLEPVADLGGIREPRCKDAPRICQRRDLVTRNRWRRRAFGE